MNKNISAITKETNFIYSVEDEPLNVNFVLLVIEKNVNQHNQFGWP